MGRPKSTTTMQRRGSSAGGAAGEASYSYAAVEGFQVVFLVQSDDGDGKMFPPVQHGHVKSLLSIANIPLLAHQLRAFHSVGFTEAIVVCEEAAITEMLDLHRLRCAAMTMLAIALPYPADGKKKPKLKDLIGLDSSVHWGSIRDADQAQQRLLYLANANELKDDAAVRTSMMRHCPNIRVHSNLEDANIYIFANWVLEMLDSERCAGYKSIKKQFVSYLVRQQHRSSGTEAIPASAQKRWEEYHQIQRMSPQLPKTSTIKSSSSPDVVQCYAL